MPAVTGNNFYIDSHDLHFRTGTTNVASISYDTSDDSISLNTAGTGAINIGDAGGDLFIGDGTSETDIVFEQNGAIRGLTNKTLTLGQTDSNVTIAAQNFTISGTGVVTDMSGRLQVQTIEATDNTAAGWAGTDNQYGTIYMSDENRGLLGNMGGGYARPLIQGGSNAITIGSNGTSAIRNIKYNAGNGAGAADSEHNFYTSGTNLRMHIAKDGNVGIGTDNPVSKLTVESSANALADVDEPENHHLLLRNPANDTTEGVGMGFLVSVATNDVGAALVCKRIGSNAQSELQFWNKQNDTTDGVITQSMTIAEDGNVGIGVADPQEKLHVYNAGTARVEIEGTTGPAAFKATNNQGSYGWYVNGNNDSFRLYDFGGGGDYITVSGNGNVAIGTDLAPQKLNVKGTIVHLNSSNIQVAGITNSSDAGRLYANNAGGVTKVLLDSNGVSYLNGGNVGIGTNSPGEKLDVVGFIRMGNATANSTQKIARQVVRAYNTSHNDFMAFMGTANQTSNVVSYGGGSNDQTCATELSFFTHTNVSTSTAGTKRARINLSGNFSLGADKYLETHNTARAHIQAQGTSVDLSSSKISDATLLLGNEYGATNSSNMANAYGLAIGVDSNGRSLLQSRRFNSSTFFDMALQPYGGNVGIGTDAPGSKLEVNGSIVGTSKSFLIDHPTQTGKKLMHACIEGPENGVYYRGRSQETGIEAPEYWSGLVDVNSMTVDVTPIGPNQSIYVERIDDNGDICVGSNTAEPLNYFYVVYGERKDIDKLEIVRDPTPPPSGADVAQ